MKKVRIIAITAIFLSVTLLFPSPPALAADPIPDLAADAALLCELGTGDVLYDYRMNQRHPADALTKIMTLLLAVSACEDGGASVDDTVVMTETALHDIGENSTTQNISPGEEMSLIDLMYCAALGRSNEACNLIAEHIAGSSSAFVADMNALAEELGCLNTNYINTHGQYDIRQTTTAMDQFIIFREAMNHSLFTEIYGTQLYNTAETNVSEPRRLTNDNTLLVQNSTYYYAPCSVGVLSATFEGGYSFVSFAEADGLSLISVVLGSETVVFEDESAEMKNLTEARSLFTWGFSQFSWRTVLSSSDLVGRVPVMHGAGADFVNLRPDSSVTLLLDNDIPDSSFDKAVTIYSVQAGETLFAPVTEGDVLGEVTLTRGDEEYGPILLVANTDIDLHRLQYIKTRIGEMLSGRQARTVILILASLVAGYIALVIRYNVLRRKRLRNIAEAKRRLTENRFGAEPQQEHRRRK